MEFNIGDQVELTRDNEYKGTRGVIWGRSAENRRVFMIKATDYLFWGKRRNCNGVIITAGDCEMRKLTA